MSLRNVCYVGIEVYKVHGILQYRKVETLNMLYVRIFLAFLQNLCVEQYMHPYFHDVAL